MGRTPAEPWPERVQRAHATLVRAGHIEPIVSVSTPEGRHHAGDPDLPGEIGSVTKVLTATLLAQMAAAGDVRLADRVPDLLPAGTTLAAGVERITLEHLASHRSGLPRLPPGVMGRGVFRHAHVDPYAGIDADRLIGSLAITRVRGTPGEAPVRYSSRSGTGADPCPARSPRPCVRAVPAVGCGSGSTGSCSATATC